jgi:Rrf2 family protein
MKISRTVGYAIRASIQLAQAPGGTSVACGQLARAGEMPERFLLQILRSLVNHGILNSTRGAEGGFSLGRDPQEISLLDVVEAIEGPLAGPDKLEEAGFPDDSDRKLVEALNQITDSVRRDLQAIRLAQLIGPSVPDDED